MKVRKVRFDEVVNKECKRELLKRPDLPVCVRRTGNTIHTDFRPIKPPKPGPGPTPPGPGPTPPGPIPPGPNPPPGPPPKPDPKPSGGGGGSGLPVGAIIAGAVGTAGALGAIGAGLRTGASPAFPEITDPAVANLELGDSQVGFQVAEEEATQGFTSGFQQVSQAGMTSRTGAQTAIQDTAGEVEMADFTPETTPYDIFENPTTANPSSEYIGEMNINEAGELETTMYETPEIIPEIAETAEAGMSALEIGGEAVAVAETAGAVGAGVGAGILAGAGAVAMGAVATVGALGYFASQGLFDFKAQEDAFQKTPYNTEQAVATQTPPKREYVMPPMNSMDQQQVMDYFKRQDDAEARYNQALADYNAAIATQQGPKTSVPSP
jgi:hypothetical protein